MAYVTPFYSTGDVISAGMWNRFKSDAQIRLEMSTKQIGAAVDSGRITAQVGARIYEDIMCGRIKSVEDAITEVSNLPALSQDFARTGREPMLGGDRRQT